MRVVKEEGIAQARLAELLEIEPISVSRLIDRMEEGGWIERRQDAADRRVRMIFPTDKSREAYGEIKSLAGEVYEEALAGLSPRRRARPDHGPEDDGRQPIRRRDGSAAKTSPKALQHERDGEDRTTDVDRESNWTARAAAPRPRRRRVEAGARAVAPPKKRRIGRFLLMVALPLAAGRSAAAISG